LAHSSRVFNESDISYTPTGWPEKVSHYQEASLDRIKTVREARFFINFKYKINTLMS